MPPLGTTWRHFGLHNGSGNELCIADDRVAGPCQFMTRFRPELYYYVVEPLVIMKWMCFQFFQS